jgi:hypothetical protein
MDPISSVIGGMSSQGQQDVNNAVGTIGASMFQMMFGQLMQTVQGFQETMQDDEDYSNQYDGF